MLLPPRAPRRHPVRRVAAAGCAAVLLLAGCVGVDEPVPADPPPEERPATEPTEPIEPPDDPDPTPEPVEETRAIVATAQVPLVRVYDTPGDDEPVRELDHPREVGAPLTFLVDERHGDDWLEVLLPVRPNGSTGWIHADDVTLTATAYRVEVELAAFRLAVYDGDDVRIETPIGVGGDGAPTPPGRYYVTELLQPPDPTGPYGPFAFGLSGFSEVHFDFAGGEGVIGIHGTNDPDSIGRQSSQGCIRIANDVVSELATFLPLGTPVEILP